MLKQILKCGILFLPLGLSISLFSQSISGNVNSAVSSRHLGYATVDIYQDGKLVANVLTDATGNFTIRLDTGLYVCKINYAGHKTDTREIRVMADEKEEFALTEDKDSRFSAVELSAIEVSGSSKRSKISRYTESSDAVYDMPLTGMSDPGNRSGVVVCNMWSPQKPVDSASYGRLTAGEINDFSKWNLWADLREHELNMHERNWMLAPINRYTLQLIDSYGLPLADAEVELLADLKVIFRTRTDNTGKAELWESLTKDTRPASGKRSLLVRYRGISSELKKAIPFESGINTLIINTSCKQPEIVDIAFVVDATGSMQDEIDYLKYDINDVVYKSKEIGAILNFRFANIFYRDHGDKYLTSTQNFTRVLSESVAFTNRHNATGGGDYPEAVDVALDSAINHLSWSENARARILFLVLDAPPHNTPEIREKIQMLAMQAAEKGIRIVPVSGSGTNKSTEYLMRTLALATNGTYTFLTDHSGIGNPHIEPSTDSYRVEILNDLLVRIIQAFTYMPDCRQYIPQMEVNLPDSLINIPLAVDTSASLPNLKKPVMEWKFYPNPTNGIVNIEANVGIKELYISDLSGKALLIVKDISAGKIVTVDLSMYATGIYLIRYPMGKQWISGKIVLVRD